METDSERVLPRRTEEKTRWKTMERLPRRRGRRR